MKKAYISLGSNKGGEFLTFKESNLYEKKFEFHAFEPEPRCYEAIKDITEKVKPNKLFHHKKAVGTYDGEATWYIGNSSVSGTLRKDKTYGISNNTIKVDIINFSKWLMQEFNKNDYIIITMDIEGAEYDLLPHMLEIGAFDYINKIGIEFHSHKLSSDNKSIENFLIKELNKKFGDDLYIGWIEENIIKFANSNPHPRANRPHLNMNMFNNF